MKTARTITLLALAAATLASSAAVMNITVDDDGNYLQNGLPPIGENSLASKAFYENATGGTNNNPDSNLALLLEVLGNWNSNNDPDLPTAPTLAFDHDPLPDNDNNASNDINAYTTLTGYDYVVFHFGNGRAGEQGNTNDDEDGWWSVWYLGGDSKVFTAVPQEGNPLQNVGGFSSARYYNGTTPPDDEVPDGGTTIASLGLALLGLSGLRRLIKND